MIQTKKMRIMAHLSQLSRRQIITPQFAADRASSFHRGEVTLDDLIDELIMLPVTEENSVYFQKVIQNIQEDMVLNPKNSNEETSVYALVFLLCGIPNIRKHL